MTQLEESNSCIDYMNGYVTQKYQLLLNLETLNDEHLLGNTNTTKQLGRYGNYKPWVINCPSP